LQNKEQMDAKNKIILDLCGGTGAWSRPYAEAGYDVRIITLPKCDIFDLDVSLYDDAEQVYGVLAAPPCTMFSMARTVAKTPRDLRGAMKTVFRCLEIIAECNYRRPLKFWALENPKARLRWFLGKPPLTFNPFDYGDAIRKPTDIWGNFNTDLIKSSVLLNVKQRKQSHLSTRELPEIPKDYVMPSGVDRRAVGRAITPQGFAIAFYNANR
jgi:hypothetical protein